MALFGTTNQVHEHADANTVVRHYKLATTLDEWEEQRVQRVMESASNKKKSDSNDEYNGEFKDFDFYSDMEQPMRYFEDLERKTDILKEGPQL